MRARATHLLLRVAQLTWRKPMHPVFVSADACSATLIPLNLFDEVSITFPRSFMNFLFGSYRKIYFEVTKKTS